MAEETASRNSRERNHAFLYSGSGEAGFWLNQSCSASSEGPASTAVTPEALASRENAFGSTAELTSSSSRSRLLTSSERSGRISRRIASRYGSLRPLAVFQS